jgi:uncharacterized cupredoxin-like copper-binding protein
MTRILVLAAVAVAAVVTVAAVALVGYVGSSSTSATRSVTVTGTLATSDGAVATSNVELAAECCGAHRRHAHGARAHHRRALKFDTTTLSAKAGTVHIGMKNPSSTSVKHGIAVEGNGVDTVGEIVRPGWTSILTVRVTAGKYTFYCPVPGHRRAGMQGTLTVT